MILTDCKKNKKSSKFYQCFIICNYFLHFRGHKSYITSVSVFDKYVFTGGADARIKKWDLASCRPMFTYNGHNSKIHKLLVTEDLVFSTSHDKTAKVWHTRITKANHTRACIRTLKVYDRTNFKRSIIYLSTVRYTTEKLSSYH